MSTMRVSLESYGYRDVVTGEYTQELNIGNTFTPWETYGMKSGKNAVIRLDVTALRGYHATQISGRLFCQKKTVYGAAATRAASNIVGYGSSYQVDPIQENSWIDFILQPSDGAYYTQQGETLWVAVYPMGSTDGFASADFITGFEGGNAPYFDIEYYAPQPKVVGNSYISGFVDRTNPIIFRWRAYGIISVFGTVMQTAAKFRWRPKGETAYTEIDITDSETSCTIPANTFTDDFIEWQVLVQTNGGWSEPSDWYTVTTVDATPQAPEIISPKNEYVETDKAITFSWEHIIDTGTAQTKADLEYSLYGGAWTGFATADGPAEQITVAPNTLPAGQIRWRVRAYNIDNVYGDWAEPAAFVGIGTPATPIISEVIKSSRPAVKWQSTGQYGYQVQAMRDGAVVWDSGENAGTAKQVKISDYLPGGEYVIRVRIIGQFNLWSDWAEYALAIDVTGPVAPTLSAAAGNGFAALSFSSLGVAKLYLLRNGVPIADVTGMEYYTDHAALGNVAYVLRAIDSNDNFTDSDIDAVTVTVQCPMLAAVDALSNAVSMELTIGSPRRIQQDIEHLVTHRYYAGRQTPVAVFAGQTSETYELPVAYRDNAEREKLFALIGRHKTMLYRDNWGNRWYVTVSTTRGEQTRIASSLLIAMTVVDYKEGIEYAEV
jgi:hypothetical protein